MKKFLTFILIFFFEFSQIKSKEPKLEEIISGMNSPWSLSFVNKNKVLITEKSGNLLLVNLKDKSLKKNKT